MIFTMLIHFQRQATIGPFTFSSLHYHFEILFAGRDGQVIVWDITTGKASQEVHGHGVAGVTNSQVMK